MPAGGFIAVSRFSRQIKKSTCLFKLKLVFILVGRESFPVAVWSKVSGAAKGHKPAKGFRQENIQRISRRMRNAEGPGGSDQVA